MKITSITARCYAKINLGNYNNNELGFEMTAELEEGEDPIEAARQLFALCQEESRLQARLLIRRRRRDPIELLHHMPEVWQVKLMAAIDKQTETDQQILKEAV